MKLCNLTYAHRPLTKKLIITLVLLCALLPLAATPMAVSVGTGYRITTLIYINDPLRFVDTEFSISNFSLYFRDHSMQMQDLYLDYDLRVGKTMHNIFAFHTEYVPKEGGFSDLSYTFNQRFKWAFFSLGYGLGIQAGLSYSEYSKELLWSLSPLIRLETAFTFKPITLLIYGDMGSKFERLWKACPLYGIQLIAELNENNFITFDFYAQSAEYLMDPWFLPYAVTARVSYTYRGNV